MRRALAFVALLATTAPHVAVMGCAVGSMSSRDSHGTSVVSEHAHHGIGCDAMMTCTTAMLETDVVDAPPPATSPVLLASPEGIEPTAAVLTADPPPPRRAA